MIDTIQRYLRPRAEISRREAVYISVISVCLFFGVWIFATELGFIEPFLLPSPIDVVIRLFSLLVNGAFLNDIWASTYRIFGGFALAALLAVPLGVLMGNFAFFQSALEPLFGAARYMPASAFVPLLIIWLGIGEAQKMAVVFIGVFFPLVLLVADISASVSRDLVNSAYTLGANSRQVFFRVLLPACIPTIFDTLRVMMGIAWTYVILAELVGAQNGLGISILQAQRFLMTDQVIAGIITVGILGVLTDVAFRMAHRRLFPYLA